MEKGAIKRWVDSHGNHVVIGVLLLVVAGTLTFLNLTTKGGGRPAEPEQREEVQEDPLSPFYDAQRAGRLAAALAGLEGADRAWALERLAFQEIRSAVMQYEDPSAEDRYAAARKHLDRAVAEFGDSSAPAERDAVAAALHRLGIVAENTGTVTGMREAYGRLYREYADSLTAQAAWDVHWRPDGDADPSGGDGMGVAESDPPKITPDRIETMLDAIEERMTRWQEGLAAIREAREEERRRLEEEEAARRAEEEESESPSEESSDEE